MRRLGDLTALSSLCASLSRPLIGTRQEIHRVIGNLLSPHLGLILYLAEANSAESLGISLVRGTAETIYS